MHRPPQSTCPEGHAQLALPPAPVVQSSPPRHATPHAPQLALSVVRLLHAPAHTVWPPGHEVAQLPATQICPAAQALPHAPQLSRSICVFAQYAADPPSRPPSPPPPPHTVSVAPHVVAHAPAEHTWPDGHAVPHTPQFALSF